MLAITTVALAVLMHTSKLTPAECKCFQCVPHSLRLSPSLSHIYLTLCLVFSEHYTYYVYHLIIHLATESFHRRRVFVLGPSHHVRLSGCALSSTEKCQTPLYDLTIDAQGYERNILYNGSLASQ